MSSGHGPPPPEEDPGETTASMTLDAKRTGVSSTRLALGALLVVCLIWGYNWVVMKIGLRYAAPFDFVALRNVGGAACLFLLLLVLRKPLRPQALRYSIVLGLLQVTGNLGLVMWALTTGAVGRISVLGYTMPFWVLLLAWPILGERIHGFEWGALALALAGLVFIFNPAGAHGTLSSSFKALGAGVFWAGATIVTRMLHRHQEVDLVSLAAWQMLFGAIPLVLIAFLVPSKPIHWTATFGMALAFNMVLANVVAWSLWLFVLRHLPTGTAGVGTLAAPVVGIVAAWAQLGEKPSPLEGVGMALIVGALALLTAIAIRRRENLVASEEPG